MGMFDGRSSGPEGSTAEVAATLQAPVLLVVEVGGMSRSAAALVQGYARFDPAVHVAGVVLNRVGGVRHYHLVKTAIEAQADVPVWGYLPWEDGLVLPERHLGLVPAGEDSSFHQVCAALGEAASRTIDLDLLYFGSEERADARLQLPHPRMTERKFVLQPLCDIAPDLRLPGQTKNVGELLAGLPEQGRIMRVMEKW